MGNSSGSFKTLFGALALMGCMWLLLVGIVTHGGMGTTATTTVTAQSMANFKHMEVVGKDTLFVHPGLDLNYMSKRRVPNGPDPIHNRRAGNSRQPPGQA
ncbi:hypothetical protein L1049_006948 [Liquidambar formosana]|uniref:Uncharacterized protein n=1 Tax=Liquidambar formosana TaxID=63359 RepID=A0AAP0WUV0_LIQFO